MNFSKLNTEELIDVCRKLYEENGVSSLLYENLKQHKGLYWALYNKGLSAKKVVEQLNLKDELKHYKREQRGWTWKRVISEARKVMNEQSFLPPAGWFQANGKSALVAAVYELDKTWADLRIELDSFEGSSFVESRNGIRWRSHPEASVSNFLYARGIKHDTGRKYPPEYAEFSNQAYGYFDLYVECLNGSWIDVEIWGEKPKGHREDHYARKRAEKELFNKDNDNFLGIEFRDCFVEEKLTKIFKPYIGEIEPHVFDKPTDAVIQSTHWSNSDELIEYCRNFAKQQPDGKFPTEEWLRKRGKWANRPGEAYNTLAIYIRLWIGGIRNLRRILNQDEHSTIKWDTNSAIAAYKDFYTEHGLTPDQARHKYRKDKESISTDVYKMAARICNAVSKYAGGSAEVNTLLGIELPKERKWTKDAILSGFQETIDKWGISPTQLLNDVRAGKIKLSDSEYKKLCQITDAVSRQFSGVREVYQELGFTPPSRPRKRRKGKQ